jgi:FixJ family two-component response regulator
MSGLDLLAASHDTGVCLATIVIANRTTTPVTVRAIRWGAMTVLETPVCLRQLWDTVVEAVELVENRLAHHTRMEFVRHHLSQLTRAEHEVLSLLLQGKANKAMAEQLQVSIRTIENRRRHLFEKMQSDSIPELVRMVVELHAHDEPRRTMLALHDGESKSSCPLPCLLPDHGKAGQIDGL